MTKRSLVLVLAVVALRQTTAWAADKPQGKPVDVPLAKLGDKFRLIGKLGEPLGEVVTVQGFVIKGPFKGYEGGLNLRVQRINGRATQVHIQICLSAYLGEFGKKMFRGVDLPTPEFGKAYEKAGIQIQTTGHYFSHRLVVYKGKKIERIVWSPADFVDREALIEGKAVSRDRKAYIDGEGWRLLTDPTVVWPKEAEGKTVEGFGTVKKADAREYLLEKGTTRLVRLEDQRGRAVELRRTAWSLNDYWWFE